MRNITEVIDSILPLVSGEEAEDLLKKVSSDAGFTAPEWMGMRWRQAGSILREHVGPNHPNYEKVVQLWSGS